MIIFWRGRSRPESRSTSTGWWIRGWTATAFLLGALCVYQPLIGLGVTLVVLGSVIYSVRHDSRQESNK